MPFYTVSKSSGSSYSYLNKYSDAGVEQTASYAARATFVAVAASTTRVHVVDSTGYVSVLRADTLALVSNESYRLPSGDAVGGFITGNTLWLMDNTGILHSYVATASQAGQAPGTALAEYSPLASNANLVNPTGVGFSGSHFWMIAYNKASSVQRHQLLGIHAAGASVGKIDSTKTLLLSETLGGTLGGAVTAGRYYFLEYDPTSRRYKVSSLPLP